jgi:hypothetical protein
VGVTVTPIRRARAGHNLYVTADVTFDSSYPTGGEPLTPAMLGFSQVVDLLLAGPKAGLNFEYDYAASKIKVMFPVGGATAAPTTLTAAPQVTTGASTASAVNATTPALTPGVSKEMGSTADLSTLTTRITAWGA